jgi:hypothetical protein
MRSSMRWWRSASRWSEARYQKPTATIAAARSIAPTTMAQPAQPERPVGRWAVLGATAAERDTGAEGADALGAGRLGAGRLGAGALGAEAGAGAAGRDASKRTGPGATISPLSRARGRGIGLMSVGSSTASRG